MRRLPTWLADGPEVSDLAYRIVERTLEVHPRRPSERAAADTVTLVEVVEHLADDLDVDEADVLRGFAELEAAGVLTRSGR